MTHESVELLSEYIKINTTNPPGGEDQAVKFLKKIFDREGIDTKIYESPEKRQSIRATLPGSGQKGAIVLLNHMDVVTANPDEWSFDPFCGDIKDGMILGRGTLDTKGLAIMEMLAMLHFKRNGITPNRDIIFLAAADEETGGGQGVEFLMNNHLEDFQADLVLNEGAVGLTDIAPDKPVMMISAGEKGICWLKLRRKGQPGHGSAPHGKNALENLSKAVNNLIAETTPYSVSPIVAEYFKNLAAIWEFLAPYQADGNPDTLIKILTETGFIEMPQLSAMLRNTISLNVMRAGEKTNVIPSYAEAELDTRILPGQGIDDWIAMLKEKMADDEIEIEVLTGTEASASPTDSGDYLVITEYLEQKYPDTVVTPSLTVGTTDSRVFRHQGIPAYGVAPIFIPMQHAGMIHGTDEQISVQNMISGTEAMTELVEKLCS